jgi:hypothetical protein
MSTEGSAAAIAQIFPLEFVSDQVLKKLCQVLWDWEDCSQCGNNEDCVLLSCPWTRLPALKSFFQMYKRATFWSIPEDLYGMRHALRSHEDLLDIIKLLKENPNEPRNLVATKHFATYVEEPNDIDQLRAFDLAMKIMTMIPCSLTRSSLVRWKPGCAPVIWAGDDSLRKFMRSTFRTNDPGRLDDDPSYSKGLQLTAKRLKTLHDVEFRGTEDLHRHLLLDPEKKVIYIFHHTSFLKEYLRLTRDESCNPL